MLWDWTFLTYCVLTIFPYFSPSKCDEDNTVWGLLFWIALGGLSYYEGVLWPVHTGDYSRRNRRLSPKPVTVAEIGDKLSPKSATIVYSVDRALHSQQYGSCFEKKS